MFPISKYERNKLDSVGLIQYRRVGRNPQDANITIANREHVSRDKTDYVVDTERHEIKKFLGYFEDCNMQKISNAQLKRLVDGAKATDVNIQQDGEYKEKAFIYVRPDGTILMDKISEYMIFLNIWKNRKKI